MTLDYRCTQCGFLWHGGDEDDRPCPMCKQEELQTEIERLRSLAGRAVVAYHMRYHQLGGGQFYMDCPKPFCVEARGLGLPDKDEAAEAAVKQEREITKGT